jgi:phosphinothricin acetyltransferase
MLRAVEPDHRDRVPLLRHADPARDAAACAAIYAPYVESSAVSFEDVAPDPAAIAARIAQMSATHAWIVADLDRGPAGFAYASPHRSRSAYRWAADVSIYVDPRYHRRGLGRTLYEALFDLLRRQGLFVACAGITLPNDASVGLHEALGFTRVGVYGGIGFKHGSWRDVGWWQLTLAEPPDGPPPEPLGPQRLPGTS